MFAICACFARVAHVPCPPTAHSRYKIVGLKGGIWGLLAVNCFRDAVSRPNRGVAAFERTHPLKLMDGKLALTLAWVKLVVTFVAVIFYKFPPVRVGVVSGSPPPHSATHATSLLPSFQAIGLFTGLLGLFLILMSHRWPPYHFNILNRVRLGMDYALACAYLVGMMTVLYDTESLQWFINKVCLRMRLRVRMCLCLCVFGSACACACACACASASACAFGLVTPVPELTCAHPSLQALPVIPLLGVSKDDRHFDPSDSADADWRLWLRRAPAFVIPAFVFGLFAEFIDRGMGRVCCNFCRCAVSNRFWVEKDERKGCCGAEEHLSDDEEAEERREAEKANQVKPLVEVRTVAHADCVP